MKKSATVLQESKNQENASETATMRVYNSIPEDREFLFSVVIPVYNTDEYLEDAVNSVIRQSLDFEENIQVILVNDGSSDSSAILCQAYQECFPNNIVFIDKKNEGVSIARNIGFSYAQGKYVNFLDSDDCWSLDAFEEAARFFEANPCIRIVTARHTFFGRKSSPHALTYKFEINRVIDILETYDHPQLSFSNAFMAKELIPENPFNPQLKVAEDFVIVNTILLDEQKYGILSRPIYWYRKRAVAGSAIDSSTKNVSWYLDTPKFCYQRLFELSCDKFGRVLPYVQFCVMYDLQWRLKRSPFNPLNDEQMVQYREMIVQLLTDISDEIIMAQRNLVREEKMFALAMKYGLSLAEVQSGLVPLGGRVYWCLEKDANQKSKIVEAFSMAQERKMRIDFITVDQDSIHIEGHLYTMFSGSDIRVVAKTDESEFDCLLHPDPVHAASNVFQNDYYVPYNFEVKVPKRSVSFYLVAKGQVVAFQVSFGKFSPISNRHCAYAHKNDLILSAKANKTGIKVAPARQKSLVKKEALFQLKTAAADRRFAHYFEYRAKAILHQSNPRRRIWLLSDRPNLANDSGEVLFEYLQQHPVSGVETYYVLSEDSIDYSRIQSIGKVIPYQSRAHLAMTLQAEVIISSSADDNVINPFGDDLPFVQDLLGKPFVFLQHGVIKDDLSSWLNKSNKSIALFITSAPRERESITTNPRYGYGDDVVLCSGLPRHDKLLRCEKEPGRALIIAPTWRNDLANEVDLKTGVRPPNPVFAQSDYYLFYQRLINDEALISAAKRKDFNIKFLIHPAFIQELDKFSSDYCEIVSTFSYADELAHASIMMTDYSSVVFDFALLKRPIVYAQLDAESFFSGHTYEKGYYDYEQDGFGPVCTTYENTIQQLIAYMDNPEMEQVYKRRVDEFFVWPERPRCEIITEAIMDIVNKNRNDACTLWTGPAIPKMKKKTPPVREV